VSELRRTLVGVQVGLGFRELDFTAETCPEVEVILLVSRSSESARYLTLLRRRVRIEADLLVLGFGGLDFTAETCPKVDVIVL
jgi:hypothetical protein